MISLEASDNNTNKTEVERIKKIKIVSFISNSFCHKQKGLV